MMASSEMASSVERVVVRAAVPGLELDEELLMLLDDVEVAVIVVLLVVSSTTTSANMSSKILSF
jgi:hypothetical protein